MKKQIGVVGVDSGRLIIIDPSYIRSDIVPQLDGNEQHFVFWGRDQRKVAILLQNEGWTVEKGSADTFIIKDTSMEDIAKLSLRLEDLRKEKRYIVMSTVKTGNFEDKVFDLTASEEQAGQLNYRLGDPGLAVAFCSGWGDGIYPVYAHYDSDGRISKIEIEF